MIYRPFSGIFMRAAGCFGLGATERRRTKERIQCQSKSKFPIQPIYPTAVIGDNACSLWQHDWFVEAGTSTLPDCLRAPFEVPFAQLLAYHLSVHAQINPDNPSPGGTITRVAKAFSIHKGGGDD